MRSGKHRVALVSGAARRVGRAVALRLADEGYDVAFTYLNSAADARQLQRQIRARGRRSLAIRADLTDPVAAVRTIRLAFDESFKRLDVLVNNASLYEPDAAAASQQIEQMRRLWAIHVESPLLLCRAFSAKLRASGGRVINMIDLLAQRPLPRYLAYCASKGGLQALTLGLARQMAPRVTVNGIAPGVVRWPQGTPTRLRRQYLRRVPLGRAGTPQDVADAVMFFCMQNSYVTGEILRLDGGRWLM
jgi:NAD(P)-dependent dehydrogenase (short-subunit alcohol dehydrogenase family)